MASISISISISISSPHMPTFISSSSTFRSYLSLRTTTTLPSKNFILFHSPNKKINRLTPILPPPPAAAEDDIISSSAEQLYPESNEGVATVVSALFFIAFIGLSAITIGVIYLAVTDFLQKREREKFEKEEATKGKKKRKKAGRARAGPRGFGQKVVQDEEGDGNGNDDD